MLEIDELESYDDDDKQGNIRDEEAKKIKFRLIGPLSKIHNIIVYIRGSTARIVEFVLLTGRMIPLNGRTRWNGWFLMLIVALLHRALVEKFCQNHEDDLEDDELTPKD